MAKQTAKQAAIMKALSKGEEITEETVDVPEIPEGPRTYMGLPGTTLVGIGIFPMTVEDPAVQERIENSRSFKQGHVWLETMSDEDQEAVDKALEGLSFGQLRKLAVALGHRNINRLSKIQLIEVCTKDGASLL